MKPATFAAFVLALMLLPARAEAIIGGSVVPQEESRYDAVAAFTLEQWRDLNVPTGNAVLIAPDRVVMPRHLINSTFTQAGSADGTPGAYVVRFRVNPDGSRGSINSPASFYHVRIARWITPTGRSAADDIVIGVLETPVTHITPMPIEWRPTMTRGKLSANLLSWGPDEQNIKGQLRVGGVSVNNMGAGQLSWQLGAYGVLNDSGAAAVAVDRQGRARLLGFLTTPRAGTAFRKWRTTNLFR
ncbi:MAG: hypothetical protein ACOYN0_01070 [Phycisphaerales bacterium]